MSALTDPIADFLTRLRNGCSAGKTEVLSPYSKMRAEIARILKQEGYISNFEARFKSHNELCKKDWTKNADLGK